LLKKRWTKAPFEEIEASLPVNNIQVPSETSNGAFVHLFFSKRPPVVVRRARKVKRGWHRTHSDSIKE
jgi:hypothetical protein